VVALRCTQRLIRRLRREVQVEVGPPSNALGHWYANVIAMNRLPLVLAISERSLLSVVVAGAPFNTLLERFPVALRELLHHLNVSSADIMREIEATTPLTVAATASRKVLGCLNQYAFELEVDFQYEPGKSLLERELWLSENISSAIRYCRPRELAVELVAWRTSQ